MPAGAGERSAFGDLILPEIEPFRQAGRSSFPRRRSFADMRHVPATGLTARRGSRAHRPPARPRADPGASPAPAPPIVPTPVLALADGRPVSASPWRPGSASERLTARPEPRGCARPRRVPRALLERAGAAWTGVPDR